MTDLREILGDRYDDVIERAARAHASIEPGGDWPTNVALGGNLTGTRGDEYRAGMREQAEEVLAAVLPDLLADAWDDGHAACIEAHGRIKPMRPNPYRPETITRDATGAPVTPAAPDAINPPPDPSAAIAGPHSPERTTR